MQHLSIFPFLLVNFILGITDFEQMVGQIYPTELQLNKANSSDTEAPFLDLNLSITNGIVSSKIYDKRDDFNFEIVNFPFLDGDVPRSPSYGVYISQLIRFARVCSNVDDFNNRNLFLTSKLLKQGYRYHKIRKAFSKFYHRHSELIVKYNIGLKTLLQRGISEPIFYGDLVYKFKRIVGKPNFSDQFKKIVKRYIRIFYVFVLSCVCYVLCASVYMCFVVTCWERADLLALVCGVFCEFVTFPLVSWVRCGT